MDRNRRIRKAVGVKAGERNGAKRGHDAVLHFYELRQEFTDIVIFSYPEW